MTRFNFTVPASLAAFVLALAACTGSSPEADDGAVAEGSAEFAGCPFQIKCAPGYHSVDTDNDGCDDACVPNLKRPIRCPAIACAPGYHSVDTNNDGCLDLCEPDLEGPIACPAIACAPGYHSVDTDNDGCLDLCEPD